MNDEQAEALGRRLLAAGCPCIGDPAAADFWPDLRDAATRLAVDAGGVVMTEAVETPRGRQSVVVDPTGAVFGLLGPATQGPRPL